MVSSISRSSSDPSTVMISPGSNSASSGAYGCGSIWWGARDCPPDSSMVYTSSKLSGDVDLSEIEESLPEIYPQS